MGKRLTVDTGNTATKLAVWDGPEFFVGELVLTDNIPENIAELKRVHGTFEAAIYSSVKHPDEDVLEAVKQSTSKFYHLSHATPLPISITYGSPGTLGSDRIAGAVGAASLGIKGWKLIVDIGTAVTYDVLSPENVFMGGNIAPGPKMRLSALHRFTSRLPMVSIDGECPEFGNDTETALRAGALRGIAAEIEHYRNALPGPATVVITGGRAPEIMALLSFMPVACPELVTKGLNSIITYNETH